MMTEGLDAKAVSERLGRAPVETTLRLYAASDVEDGRALCPDSARCSASLTSWNSG
jgi:hypothetical protein